MASITVRNLGDDVKKRLRKQAAENGRSLEAEVREILTGHGGKPAKEETGADLFDRIHARFKPYGGLELPEIRRRGRKVPTFK